MAKIISLRRKRPRIKNLTRIKFGPEISAIVGTSVATATVNGRFGMIGTAPTDTEVAGVANGSAGRANAVTTVNGVINAGSMVGTSVQTTKIGPIAQTTVLGVLNSDASFGTAPTVTTAKAQAGSIGSAVALSTASATGITYVQEIATQDDFAGRIKSLLPPSWFEYSNGAPVLNIPVFGMAYGLLWIYIIYLYTIAQSRIATATGVWLDRIAYDFLGANKLPRLINETDANYRVRLKAAILAPKQTRAAISQSLNQLTGYQPKVIELWNPGDTGTYGTSGSNGAGTQGYGVAGMYGSLSFRNQFFVTAYRPQGEGIPGIPGYGQAGWAYGKTGVGEYADFSDIVAKVKDTDIYASIAATIGAGNTAWTAIQTPPDITDAPIAYFGNVNNSSLAAVMFNFFF